MLPTKLLLIVVVALTSQLAMVSEAQAGPLLDWLRGIRRNNTRPILPQYGFNAPAATPDVGNLQPGQCLKTCQQTCSRTVVNYVPYTAYRTNWNRVPVTQYRPVTSTDPCTGCTMTCMKPCTTYTYQMQRVPYTTYRPVYRQESYRVPVTTLVDNCADGSCQTGCDTCGTGVPGGGQNFAPQQPDFSAPVFSPGVPGSSPADSVPSLSPTPAGSTSRVDVPRGTLSADASYELRSAYQNPTYQNPSYQNPTSQRSSYSLPVSTGQPALEHTARVPDVNTATQGVRPQTNQRPFLDRLQNQGSRNDFKSELKQAKLAPLQRQPLVAQTQLTSLHRRWSYSPVRLASNRSADARPSFTSVTAMQQINSVWGDVK